MRAWTLTFALMMGRCLLPLALAFTACGARVDDALASPDATDAGLPSVRLPAGCPRVPARKIGASALSTTVVETSLAPDSPAQHCGRGPAPGVCPNPGERFYGQDGNFEIRVPSYTSATDVVRDSVTGLEWQRLASKTRARSLDEARAMCESLTMDGGGFRLPTRIEAISLWNYGAPSPALDVFGAPLRGMWTSSVSALGNPWIVDGLATTVAKYPSATDPYAYIDIRCVRGTAPSGAATISADGDRVFDPSTGLEWQRETSDVPKMSLECGLAYCAAIGSDPARPFRVPTVKELSTIVVAGKSPSIDPSLFPDTAPEPFMTSTITLGTPGDGDIWVVDFGSLHATSSVHPGESWTNEEGTISPYVDMPPFGEVGTFHVRCVR